MIQLLAVLPQLRYVHGKLTAYCGESLVFILKGTPLFITMWTIICRPPYRSQRLSLINSAFMIVGPSSLVIFWDEIAHFDNLFSQHFVQYEVRWIQAHPLARYESPEKIKPWGDFALSSKWSTLESYTQTFLSPYCRQSLPFLVVL